MTNSSKFNFGYQYREQVCKEFHGQTLLHYLARQFRHSNETEWRMRIEKNHVLINETQAEVGSILSNGDTVSWRRPPWIEPAAPTDFSVLYEDEHIIAAAKPAGLPTLPGANFFHNTLLHHVQLYDSNATPLHRLGRWTSGIVLCARTHTARQELLRQWSARAVLKRYRALAEGSPQWDTLTVATPIGPVPHALLESVHAASPKGKAALSHISVRERRENAFICDVNIETGRPHQIRIHLAAAGHPLVGDPLYGIGGVPIADTRAVPGDPGYALHAAELRFRHPHSGRNMLIECEPPELLRLR